MTPHHLLHTPADFTMSLMSIQPLYYVLDGPEHVYGLTFGSYDLTAMLFAPLFGYWTDLTGTFKKQVGWAPALPATLPISHAALLPRWAC